MWYGIWTYTTDAACYAVPYCDQQAFNNNPTPLGSWQFTAVSFPWPAAGTVSCGAYKTGGNTGSVYIAAPLLMPVG